MIHYEIYKEDSKGKTRVWFMESEEGRYRAISGLYKGNLITDTWTEVQIKNAGKANETSLSEQTKREVEAKYKKKLEKDYHVGIGNIKTKLFFAPMLAETYKEGMEVTGWFSQPKLNGMRCILKADGAWTRKGKPIVSIPHIIEEYAEDFKADPDLVLDGELYNHDMHDDFNTLMSILRKEKNVGVEEIALSKEKIQIHIYDVPSELNFEDRKKELDKYQNRSYTVVVESTAVQSAAHRDDIYKNYLLNNYEGQILRPAKGKYENKRSKFLWKRKTFQDEEFEIHGFKTGKGNWSGVAKTVICYTKNGDKFEPTIKGTKEYCEELLKRESHYIGGTVKVKFFSYTPDGIPLFPIAIDLIRGKRVD